MRAIAQRSDIRDLILDGVDVLLSRYGYRKMTMEDLARQVGIGKGTIYLHFTSKEEIALSHISRIVDRLIEQLQLIAQSNLPVLERLQEMLLTRVLYRFDSVQHYTQSLNELMADLRPSFLPLRQHHFQQEANVISRLLTRGKKDGLLQCTDPQEVAQALITATNSLLPYSLSTQELGSRDEIEKRTREVSDLILRALLPAPKRILRRS
jgi:AcrR family transcriptional regulator